MGRPRKHDRHLPACMYHRHGAYYHVQRGVWTRLATDLPGALREYARHLEQSPPATGGMPALIDIMLPRILKHARTGKPHAPDTQRQYKHCAGLLRAMLPLLEPQALTRRDVISVRNELQATPAVANRTVTVLRLILAAAVDDEIIDSNPAIGVEPIPMQPRTRRMTTAEFDRIHAHADPLLRAVMLLCYATGQRLMDAASIRTEDVSDAGVYFKQQKTGAEVIIAWTPTLRAAVDAARALHPNALRPAYLLGHRAPTYPMIRKRWVAARNAARVPDVVAHDIRAMAATDARAQGIDPQALLGHADARTTRIYLRDRVVPVVAGPVMKRSA